MGRALGDLPEPLWATVFDAGYRRTDDGRGRGLGLAEARDAAERAGGSIRAGVADLGGARFTVVLPARDHSAAAADVDDPRVLSG